MTAHVISGLVVVVLITSKTGTIPLSHLTQLDSLSLQFHNYIGLESTISRDTLLAPHEESQIKREVEDEEQCEFNFMVY